MNLRKSAPVAVLLAFLGFSSLALAANVQTDYDHQADFTRYKSYSWGDVKVQSPLFADRIRNAVNQDLKSKGWQQVPSGGKVTLFAIAPVHSEQELETTYYKLGPDWGGIWRWNSWSWGAGGGFTSVAGSKDGDLVLDIFDSSSKTLVFRGIAQQDLKNNPDKDAKQLDKDLVKILLKFPPK